MMTGQDTSRIGAIDMEPFTIADERIGTSSPKFSLQDFREMYLWMHEHFRIWEIVAEARHHASIIVGTARELLETHPLKLQIHAPLSDINIGSVSETIRHASVNEVVGSLKLASELDIEVVTFHPGHLSPLTKNIPEFVYTQTSRSLNEISRAAQEYGVTACVENMPNFIFTRYQTPKELLEAIRDSDFLITLDVGHANTSENLISYIYPEIVDNLGNVHLHDNAGDRDAHLAPGEGTIDFPWLIRELETLGYQGNYILESNDREASLRGKRFMQTYISEIPCDR